jgi:FlgD Ig-like domain
MSTMLRRMLIAVAAVTVSMLTVGAVPTAFAAGPTSTPTIVSPAFGAVITTPSVEVTVQSSAASVRFDYGMSIGGGTATVPVVGGEASLVIDVIGRGPYLSFAATDCGAGGCSDSSTGTSWTVDLPDPVIVSPTRKQIVGSEVEVSVTAPGGSVAFTLDGRKKATDQTAPYEVTIPLAAKPDGEHDLLVTQCAEDGVTCEGAYDFVTFIKDTVGPKWSTAVASRSTFYPVDDQYLDVVTLSSRAFESVYAATVEIRRADGSVVRTLQLGDRRSGTIDRVWDGRNQSGNVVADGQYEFRFIAEDIHGVQGVSEPGFVRVSGQEVVRKTFTKRVSAARSALADISGDCSRVGRTGRWTGALGWRSNDSGDCSGTDSIAASVHGARLDKLDRAVRYVSLQIAAYGGAAPRTRSQATLFYVKPSGDLAAQESLNEKVRWHSGDKTDLEAFIRRTKVRWVVATRNGNSYDIKDFRVSYTVLVLQ